MSFNLNNEKATGILIWWIEGADGSIDPQEEEAIAEVLSEMKYSMDDYRQETKMFISGLSNERMQEAVDESIQWGAAHFDEQRKNKTLHLLNTIARSDSKEEDEQEKLERIKKEWGR